MRRTLQILLPLLTLGCSFIDDFGAFSFDESVDAGVDGATEDAGARLDAGEDGGLTVDDAGRLFDAAACMPTAETCNELDDDCDSTTDEDPTECSFPNATTRCSSGACEMDECDSGFGDCSVEPGCETDIASDRSNCGECEHACLSSEVCTESSCLVPTVEWVVVTTAGSTIQSLGEDRDGNLYIAGRFQDAMSVASTAAPTTAASNVYVASLTATGEVRWIQSIGNDGLSLSFKDMIVDELGNAYVAGNFRNNTTTPDGVVVSAGAELFSFIWSLRPDGSSRWLQHYSGPFSVLGGLDFAPDGTVVGAGFFDETIRGTPAVGGRDIFVVRASPLTGIGNPTVVGSLGDEDAQDVSVGPDGSIYLTGSYAGEVDFGFGDGPLPQEGGNEVLLMALSADLVVQWAHGIAGPSDDFGQRIAVGSAGEIFVSIVTFGGIEVGSETFPAGGGGVLASFTPAGTPRWSFAAAARLNEHGQLHVGSDGGLWWAVGVRGSFLGVPYSPMGSADALAGRVEPSTGSHIWSRSFGGAGLDVGTATFPSGDAIYLAGAFADAVDFDGMLRVTSAPAGFLVRLSP